MEFKNKAVIFDFNGTMIFGQRIQEKSWKKFIKNKTGRSITEEEFSLYVHGRNPDITLKYFIDENLTKEETEVLIEEKEIYYRQLCLDSPDEFRLAEGLPEFLDRLKAENIPLTIATASPYGNLKFFFRELKLSRWFDISLCVWSDGSFEGKPKPDIYIKAAERLNKLPEDCIVIEDSEACIKAAQAAEIGIVIGISSMLTGEKLVSLNVNAVIENYREL
ncbi:MAG: HAD family phosphatase [Clostridiales bacterium]|nr:HAD family phosphatase [Clostridiales bacterium]